MKKKLCVVMMCLGAILATVARADLVARYTFDDGTAADGSGNSNNGVLFGNVAPATDAERGAVMNFGGGRQFYTGGKQPQSECSCQPNHDSHVAEYPQYRNKAAD
ncbi:MAG: hypothetical protein KBI46_04545 [Phycisphaerae bacterium]|nr:hypothetical protein [Phycisphaerae bacterium]